MPNEWPVSQRDPAHAPASVESLCAAFCGDCAAGRRSPIEMYLAAAEHSDQPALFARLLTIELEHRRAAGEHPTIAEYAARFPVHRAIVDAILLETAQKSPSFDSTIEPMQSPALSADYDFLGKPASAGSAIGRYKLIEEIGRGAFGQVWRALDPLLGRHVAVKILRPDRTHSPDRMQRLQAEARKMANIDLDCFGIVRVLDVGTSDGGFFIVTQIIEGESLAQRLSGPRLSHSEVSALIASAAEAVHQAHLKDLTHRDLKPANILLDRAGRPHIADFGLAISEDEQLVERASTTGTAAYMAPEQAKGESNRVDARTDVWALGVILYQLLCGRVPFKASTQSALFEQIVHREPRPVRTIDDTVPPELERICLKCLAKPMGMRYMTACDLALDLRRWIKTVDVATPRRHGSKWIAFSACSVFSLISWWIIWHISHRKPEAIVGGPHAHLGENLASSSRVPSGSENLDRSDSPPAGLPNRQNPDAIFTPLIASPSAKGLSLQTLADRTSLRAGSQTVELISLGRLDAENDELEIDLEQDPWTGGIGMFFGHGPGVDHEEDVESYQALVLSPGPGGDWKLLRIRYSYPVATPSEWKSKNLQHADITKPTNTTLTLRMRFSRQALADVAVNGIEIPDVCDARDASRIRNPRSAGRFGLLLNHTGGIIARLVVNGKRQRFLPAQSSR